MSKKTHTIYAGVGDNSGNCYIIEKDAATIGCIFACAMNNDGTCAHDWYELGWNFYAEIIADQEKMKPMGRLTNNKLEEYL